MTEFQYKNARAIFQTFKKLLEQDSLLQEEFLDALTRLLTEYNTTIYENRFVAGGAVEYILTAAFNGTSVLRAKHIGKYNDRLDIEVRKSVNEDESTSYSVKSVFTAPSSVRLINVLGDAGNAQWIEPTIFVLAGIGIVYADCLILPGATKNTGDALILERQPFQDFIKARPEFGVMMSIPRKSTEKNLAESKTASEDVARLLLRPYKKLRL